MPHFRVDDGLNNHPKARKAGLEAMGLWSLCGSYCMAYLTDGFVPEWYVQTWPKGTALAKRLVAAGFWLPTERDGEQGWEFHEFLGPGRQDSREKIEADRELARKRKAKWRESHAESQQESHRDEPCDEPCDEQRDTPRDERPEERRSPGYTQPNPTQVKNSGSETYEPPVSSATNGRRGGRLPAGWEPSTDVVAQMRSDHPHVDLKAEHSKFVDYWHDQPGAKGRKVDWTGTWRNWIRRAAEQQPAARVTPINGHAPTAFQRKTAHNAAVFNALGDQPNRPELLS